MQGQLCKRCHLLTHDVMKRVRCYTVMRPVKCGKVAVTPRYVTVTFKIRVVTTSPKRPYVWSIPGNVDQVT